MSTHLVAGDHIKGEPRHLKWWKPSRSQRIELIYYIRKTSRYIGLTIRGIVLRFQTYYNIPRITILSTNVELMIELRLIEETMLLRRHYGELRVLSFLPIMKICMVCWNYLVFKKKDYLSFLTEFDSPMDLLKLYL